ncbi:MAG: hypothetical protein QOE92_1315 [Chloroflexota bacterium]|jgi:hypothetical protein|nr:hypothetical protein [Chloroflexota bacterium]
MTGGMRLRIVALQVGLIAVLGAGGLVALGMGSFVHGMIRDQLSAQQIFFPAAGSASLPASEYPDLQQYGGQQVDDGVKAQAYANGFIGRHLEKVAGGQTYSQVSTKAAAAPTDTALAGQKDTLFKGETLRGLLLNTYGWWTIGTYSTYAGYGLALAAAIVLLAMLFEIGLAIRSRGTTAVAPIASTRLAHQG